MSTCYFHYLAPELVQEIFIFSIVKRSGYFVEFKSDAAPLSLLHVCKRWRIIAYATSELFDSITLRRRVHSPIGFDFLRDSYIILDFLKFSRNAAPWLGSKELNTTRSKRHISSGQMLPPRPLSIELRYGDIRQFGNTLMWSDLVSMTRAILDTTSNLERFHLRFPDDCMEKILSKICLDSGKPIVCPSLKSLSLHSTRESILVKRYEKWWTDGLIEEDMDKIHTLDTSGIPELTELGLHFPGPLTLDPECDNVRTLNISIFKWFQLDAYLYACQNVEHLIIELRLSLEDTEWQAVYSPLELTNVQTVEIRSHLSGMDCSNQIARIFAKVNMTKLKHLILRRHQGASKTEPTAFAFNYIFHDIPNLEEIEFIDFPPDICTDDDESCMLVNLPKLRRIVYREVELDGGVDFMMLLLSQLRFYQNPLCAPCLEVLEIDTIHYRVKCPRPDMIDRLLNVIASRRVALPPASTKEAEGQVKRRLLRKVYLPSSCLEIVRCRDTNSVLEGVHLGPVSDIEPLENEDDLDDEGEPRDPGYVFKRPNWDDNMLNATSIGDRAGEEDSNMDNSSELMPVEEDEDEDMMNECELAANSNKDLSTSEKEDILGADDQDTYTYHEYPDMDYSKDYEEDEDMDSMGGDTLIGSSQGSRPNSYHSASALKRYDSVAEVEAML